MWRLIGVALVLLQAGPVACDSGGNDDDVVGDRGDASLAADVADLSDESEALVVTGRVVDDSGLPVAEAMLVMCGTVEGAEVCLQEFAEADGTFQYDDLSQGYSHLQLMPHLASVKAGKLYAGASFLTDFPAPPATFEWGDIVLPVIEAVQLLVVVEGGLLDFDTLTLNVPPTAAAFPDLQPEGEVGARRVSAELLPFAVEGAAIGYAFYPFDTRLSAPATARIPLATLDDIWDGDTSPIAVWVNSTDIGGLYEVPTSVEGSDLVFEVSELTWIIVVVG